jgi:hypothetical protein
VIRSASHFDFAKHQSSQRDNDNPVLNSRSHALKYQNVPAVGGPLHGRLVDHHADTFIVPTDPPAWAEGSVVLHSYTATLVPIPGFGRAVFFVHESVAQGDGNVVDRVMRFLSDHPIDNAHGPVGRERDTEPPSGPEEQGEG